MRFSVPSLKSQTICSAPSAWKFRTRFLPQSPAPTTPTRGTFATTFALGIEPLRSLFSVKICYRCHNSALLLLAEFRIDWKGQNFPAGRLGGRKITHPMLEIGKCALQMQRLRVVNFSRNPSLFQMIGQCFSFFHADGELIVDVRVTSWRFRSFHHRFETEFAEQVPVLLRVRSPRSGPAFQMTELHPKNRSLQSVEPTIHSQYVVFILLLGSMHAQHAQPFRKCSVICGHHAAVAGPSEVLGREEAKAPHQATLANRAACVSCADRLRCVFDDWQFMG